MKTITETAYAKINLGLDIIGKRSDGYHEVSMIMQSVGLSDEIVISAGQGKEGITIATDMAGLSCGSDNLAYKAAELLARYAGINPHVHIALKKKIFLAAGLAGGSSDAAAVLRGLNKYWRLNLNADELRRLAAQLGSDIPFCIEGGTALATGRGEILTQLDDLSPAAVVLAKPKGLEVSTAWVYQHYNKGRVVHAPCIWQLQAHLQDGARALVPYMGNVLETVTIPAHPVIASIKAAMLGAGAYYALMSGSGPTVFALAPDQEAAANITAALADFSVETAITTIVGRIK
ncbi:MAG: 4-(cytidine 5'-diphospho)-2-C-methyl-D-erythritol kinase [Phascolarctobacterium sp.]|uniref:4-(cytidine 5'-diphospho)-2-C-methyl-D-erythritol kinase n=1 Tax=Phascolarctobacterium sp. TaxID=2049039 RepID=UPI0026DC3DD8|nr:4-(cytidine 5'-diphospho)-2-C-methyl-D-erythritol kinase [Phascolarctobacterium sp.]MDO4920362.1 4-(cytidine 5'-diphospho)-2-C-methyl-D-erythritol kinase [Phascolarctobacterium sp.]